MRRHGGCYGCRPISPHDGLRCLSLSFWWMVMATFFMTSTITIATASVARFRPRPRHNPTIRIINLDRDKERWQKVLRQFQNADNGHSRANIKRLPAVDGKTLTPAELLFNATLLARLFCTQGTIGCYLSHRTFWKEVAEGDEPYQILLEDDALLQCNQSEFLKCTQEAMSVLQEEHDEDWDVLLLGAFGSNHPTNRRGVHDINSIVMGDSRKPGIVGTTSIPNHNTNLTIHIPKRPFGCHAYALSKHGAKKLMDKAWYANGHVDMVIWGMQELKIYSLDPMLVRQDMTAPSTIGVGLSSSFWDRLTSILLPDNLLVDDYSGISLRWALGEPLVRIPLIGTVVTIGITIYLSVVGLVLGSLFQRQLPWLLPIQAVTMTIMLVLLRLMGRPVGRRQQTV